MSMYKKRNIIRLTALVVFLSLAGLIYLLTNQTESDSENTIMYVLGAIAVVGAIYYFVKMRQFKSKLNNYFEQKEGGL